VGAQAGFADGVVFLGEVLNEFVGGFHADGESFQVAIVDADNAGVRSERAVEFLARVDFDKRLHVEFTAEGDEVAEKFIAERDDHKEETVGVVGAGFPDLPWIKDEILAQSRKRDFFAGIAKVFQRAPEELSFRKNRESSGASGFEGFGKRGRIKRIANDAARGRGRLQFRNYIEGIARESGGKITDSWCRLYAISQRGFGQDTFAVSDLGATRFEDAVEDGARVGIGSQGDKFVC